MLPSLLRQRIRIQGNDLLLLTLRGLSGAATFYLTLLAFENGALSVTMVLFFTCPLWALFMGALFLKGTTHLGKNPLCRHCNRRHSDTHQSMGKRAVGKGVACSHLYGLAAGILGGANSVLTRHLRIRHSSRVIYAVHSIMGTLVSIPLIIGPVRMPGLTDGTLLLVAAAFGLLGQVAMNHGFRFIRAAEGSTLLMVEVILTTIAGIVLFQEPFALTFFVGAVLILGSGIYLGLRTGNDTIGIDHE